MVGPLDSDLNPQGVGLGGLELESYELRYDLYLDFNPSGNEGVAVNLMMPDDSLRYKFFLETI